MLFALAWMPTAARAAGNIVITYINISGCVLQVELSDGNGLILKSMTVHFYSGTTDVYDATNMAYAAGPANDQVWDATGSLSAANLPPGSYTLTVDATDANETDLGLPSPDYPIPIGYSTQITAAASPATLGYGNTRTTISGKVTGVKTCSSNSVGMGGVPIDLTDQDKGITTQIATTQSDGSYSAAADLPTAGDNYLVTAASGPTWTDSYTGLPLTWAEEPTRLVSVTATPQDASNDGTVTLAGVAQVDSPTTGWQPLADFSLQITAGSTYPVLVPTDSQGQFSYSYPARDGTTWSIQLSDGGQLVQTTTTSGSIHVAVPLRFSSFTSSLNPFAQLTVTACVQSAVPGFNGPAGPIQVQYSAQPSGPWTTLGHLARRDSPGCSLSGQSYFSGSLPVRLARAYYRAYLPATPDNQAAASNPVLRWKYVTRIITLHVSPSTVHRGGKLTVSGRLQAYNRTWQNFAGQQVLIVLKPNGSTVWYWIVKVRTTSSGYFTSTFTDPVSASWSAVYEGDSTHFACGGAVYYVPVSGASSALVRPPDELSPSLIRLSAIFRE
jgi:hypothetical protein